MVLRLVSLVVQCSCLEFRICLIWCLPIVLVHGICVVEVGYQGLCLISVRLTCTLYFLIVCIPFYLMLHERRMLASQRFSIEWFLIWCKMEPVCHVLWILFSFIFVCLFVYVCTILLDVVSYCLVGDRFIRSHVHSLPCGYHHFYFIICGWCWIF